MDEAHAEENENDEDFNNFVAFLEKEVTNASLPQASGAILENGEKNVLKATKYQWMPSAQRRLHRGEFSAKIAFYVPDMIPNDDETYTINAEHARWMEERYEAYNFGTGDADAEGGDHSDEGEIANDDEIDL
jgi:hypothetical protein